jgi:DNA-binding transcriptional regulator YdaS (Cro superfamily)
MSKEVIERASQIVGNQTVLAKLLGVSRGTVSHWKYLGIPAERVLDIERATGRQVTRQELRPDLYPDDGR